MNAHPPDLALLGSKIASSFDKVSRLAPATIVFDLDGTLVDTAPDLAHALNHCLGFARLPPVSLDVVRPLAGLGMRAMLLEGYRQAGVALDPSELADQTTRFLEFYELHIAVDSRLFDGARQSLESLIEGGFQLAVCTNKTEALARRLLAELELLDWMQAVCGSDTFAHRKPHPAHLSGTLHQAGGAPSRSVMVGDTQTDIQAAQALGIPSVLMTFGYGASPSAMAGASLSLASFHELTPRRMADLLDLHSREALVANAAP